MIIVKKALFASLIFLASFAGAEQASSKDSKSLLKKALAPPHVAYQGHLSVTQWNGKTTKAEEIGVRFSPPHFYRWEFLKPDGGLDRVVVSDGEQEQIHLPKQKKILTGSAAKSSAKQISSVQEWDLLLKNYDILLAGAGVVADSDPAREYEETRHKASALVRALELCPPQFSKAAS